MTSEEEIMAIKKAYQPCGKTMCHNSWCSDCYNDDCEEDHKQVGGDHYAMPIEPIEFIVKNDIPYREGNVIKYVCRHTRKNGREDLLKARHYIDMLLEDYA